MAKSQNNLIGGIVLIALALLIYEMWKSGALSGLLSKFTGTAAAQNTASASGYTGQKNNAATTTSQTNPSSVQVSSSGAKYTVQSGDNLSTIAAQNGVSLAALEAANPSITNPNLIYAGQQITIPDGHSVSTQHQAAASSAGSYSVNESTGQYYRKAGTQANTSSAKYTVQSGNNLYDIAASHGLTLAQIEKLNPQLSNPNLIYPGEEVSV